MQKLCWISQEKGGNTRTKTQSHLKEREILVQWKKLGSVWSSSERDDVSRLTTGKKQTKTRYKLKKQKRFLIDTMANAHRKFLAEYPERKVSYSLFCHLHPFWVVTPTLSERETCLCKMHENLDFVTDKLYYLRLLPHRNIEESRTGCMWLLWQEVYVWPMWWVQAQQLSHSNPVWSHNPGFIHIVGNRGKVEFRSNFI